MPQLHSHCIRYQFHRPYSHISITIRRHSHQHSLAHCIQQQIHIHSPHLCHHMLAANTGDRLHHHNNNINKYDERERESKKNNYSAELLIFNSNCFVYFQQSQYRSYPASAYAYPPAWHP